MHVCLILSVIKSRPNESADTADPYEGPPRTITGTLKIFKKRKKSELYP